MGILAKHLSNITTPKMGTLSKYLKLTYYHMFIISIILFLTAIVIGYGIAALFTFIKCRIEGKKAINILTATKNEIDALFHET